MAGWLTSATSANLIEIPESGVEYRRTGVVLLGIPVTEREKRTVDRTIRRYFGIDIDSCAGIVASLKGQENTQSVTPEFHESGKVDIVQVLETYGPWQVTEDPE